MRAFERLLDAMSRGVLEEEETLLRYRSASSSGIRTRRVLRKMPLRNMNVCSLDRTLQDRPETLNAFRMIIFMHPFFFRVIDRTMLIAKPSQLRVSPQFVRGNCRAASHVVDDVRLKVARRTFSTTRVITSPFRSSIPNTTVLPEAPRPRLPSERLSSKKYSTSQRRCHEKQWDTTSLPVARNLLATQDARRRLNR